MNGQEIKAVLELPKSGLIVREKAVVKTGGEDKVIGKHLFEDIERVGIVSKIDPASIVLCLGAGAGSVAGKTFIPNQTAAWIVCIILGLIFLFVMALLKKSLICIETRFGSVEYDIMDSDEEGRGFAVSVQSLVARVKKNNEEKSDA